MTDEEFRHRLSIINVAFMVGDILPKVYRMKLAQLYADWNTQNG